jgi:ribosome-associated protein
MNQLGEVVLSSQRFRDQARKVEDCLEKLRGLILAVISPPTPRRKTKVPAGVRDARLRSKSRTASKKQLRQPPSSDD